MYNTLYINLLPGAPIISTINGRRHEIRLAGPAPEVKIEPEPSYELSRFLNQARIESQQQMAGPRPPPPPVTSTAATVKGMENEITSIVSKRKTIIYNKCNIISALAVEPKADLNALLNKLKTSGIMYQFNKRKQLEEVSSDQEPKITNLEAGDTPEINN